VSDDDTDDFTPEDRAAVGKAWRELIEDKTHGGKLHYSPVPIRGMPAPGSFRIPKDIFAALGNGDLKVSGLIVHQMFGIETTPTTRQSSTAMLCASSGMVVLPPAARCSKSSSHRCAGSLAKVSSSRTTVSSTMTATTDGSLNDDLALN
jgi:hypothetical protein